ncbi:kinesin-domain-containing protein [Backusella circina FSU 941]|nr:kinesin-domain-containing protein [Backusella circina FSU 941]
MTKESISTAVQVALRIRPLTDRDRAQPRFANLANDDVLKIIENTSVQVIPHNKQFRFDHVFDTESRQQDVFTNVGDPLVRKFIEGYNVTILAYGQTSSGKTYTMGTAGTTSNQSQQGIVPRSMALLFDLLQQQSDQVVVENSRPLSPTSSVSSFTSATHKSKLRPVSSRLSTSNTRHSHISSTSSSSPAQRSSKYSVKVSFIEIYNEELNDLLNLAPVEERPPVTIREDTKGTIYWTGVKEVSVYNTDDVLNYLEQGTRNRATGSTDMNEKSSRSHAIFTVSLRQEKASDNSKTLRRPASSMSVKSNNSSSNKRDDEWMITTSKFHFVDLAGSERLKRTAAQGDRRKEGININAGLSALGNVISALGGDKKVHIPYRDSKLTRLLQDSLGGNATTLMIACASPAEHNLSETLNTLQYASRARNIRNKSEKNEVEEWMSSESTEFLRGLISKLKSEVKYLKSSSSASKEDRRRSTSSSPIVDEDEGDAFDQDFEQFHDQRMMIADLKRQVEELDGEATVTRQRNRIVEKELQRLHALLESKSTAATDIDFEHLVEPVIEEYEKSISKLESQLAMTRAALNHTNTTLEEQSNKISEMEAATQQQELTITDLRTRLSKIMEREHTNETYIQELESKLIKSANEATRDQEMLNELKSRILKLKETDENTEQYINSLEERLSAGDTERVRLRALVEELETKLTAPPTDINSGESLVASNSDALILQELGHVNSKLLLAEKERDSFKIKMEQLQKKSTTPTPSISKEKSAPSATSSTKSIQRKGGVASNEPPVSPVPTTSSSSSSSSTRLLQAEKRRVQEEAERANRLQLELNTLKQDHEETVKELDEVLQRYQEALEQVDDQLLSMDDDNTLNSSSITSSTSSKLVHLGMHNEQFCAKEKQVLHDHIAELEKRMHDENVQVKELSSLEGVLAQLRTEQDEYKQRAMLDSECIQRLEAELSQSNTKEEEDALKQALEQDIKKLNKCLDDKEEYIDKLKTQKDQLEQERNKLVTQRDELEQSLNESQGHSEGLHKRLSDTLASLTVLKIKHDQLLKNNAEPCELKRELDETVAKKESLTQLLHSMMEEKRLLSADIAQLEDELDSLHQLHAIEKDEAERTRRKLETLERVKSELLDPASLDVTEAEIVSSEAASERIFYLEHALDDMASEKTKLIKAHEAEMEEILKLLANLKGNKSPLSAVTIIEPKINHEMSTDDRLSNHFIHHHHQKEDGSEIATTTTITKDLLLKSQQQQHKQKVGQCPNGKQPISLEPSSSLSSFETLKKEIVLLNETNQANEAQIEIQRHQIESMTRTMESLNGVNAYSLPSDQKQVEQQEERIRTLEADLKQVSNDHLDQVKRSESYQKEVYRITKELGATSEQYKSTVLRYEQQLAEINQLLTENIISEPVLPNISEDDLLDDTIDPGIRRFLQDGDNKTETEKDDGVFKHIRRELYDLKIKAREAADAKQVAEQELADQQVEYHTLMAAEREKLNTSQKAQRILEKRIDELLRKRKFMCF